MMKRLMSDLRDLWTLMTKGQPQDDPFMPWRMAAELAKVTPSVNLDRWEAEQFAANPLAVWFDPHRYRDTAYDWPSIQSYRRHQSLAELQNAANYSTQQQYANYVSQLAYMQRTPLAARSTGLGSSLLSGILS